MENLAFAVVIIAIIIASLIYKISDDYTIVDKKLYKEGPILTKNAKTGFYQIYEYHYKNGKVKLRMTKSQM